MSGALSLRLLFRSKAAQSPGYRADIDGLRAIAVLAVVFFHAHVTGFGGGYVGVDIFFVISGFLITGILQREMERGTFSFALFYERRMRRIFPALFTVVLVFAAVGWLVFDQWSLRVYGESLLAVSGFVSNVYFRAQVHDLAGYFKQTYEQQWLLHTWSLSLEEQFYLFFPMLLLCLHRLARRYIAPIVLVLFFASFGLSARGVFHSPIATFYLLPARAWELLLGSLLALKVLPPLKSVFLRSVAGVSGLCAIAYAVIFFTEKTHFPGPAALLPCGGAALLLYAGEDGDAMISRILGWRPLVFVGAISYSLYLWHWPVILLTESFFATSAITHAQMALAVLLSFALAVVSFECIETPFRKRGVTKASTYRAVLVGVVASVCIAAVGYAFSMKNVYPDRFSAESQRLIALNGGLSAGKLDGCGNYHPSPSRYEDMKFCTFGDGPNKTLVWGDSHGEQLYPLLESMRKDGELRDPALVFAIAEGCVLSEHVQLSNADYRCDSYMRYALMRAAKPDVDIVFIVFSPWWILDRDGRTCLADDGRCSKLLSGAEAWRTFLGEMEQHIIELQRAGKHVVLTVPFPIYRENIPVLDVRNIMLARLHIPERRATPTLPENVPKDVRALAMKTDVTLYDPQGALCPDGTCIYAENNVSFYADDSHLSVGHLEVLRRGLRDVLGAP
jgi:peptidoglycan/LPS O-acetylase OafA/YrhL